MFEQQIFLLRVINVLLPLPKCNDVVKEKRKVVNFAVILLKLLLEKK